MEAVAISQANLNTIAQNMEAVAKELNGVINNINDVNNKMNNMDSKILGLNNDVNSIIEEIRSNTIINNARQSIMYNNNIIEKKYGYYDNLRRNIESMLERLDNNILTENEIKNLKNNISMNNPNYWLANASLAIINWLLNNKDEANRELKVALKKDCEKTCLLMIMLYLKLGKKQTVIHWLNYYLNHQDPLNIKSEFITILDLVSSSYLGEEGKGILISTIQEWLNKLNNNIKEKQTNKWIDKINNYRKERKIFNNITDFAKNKDIIINNITIFESYHQTSEFIDNILNAEHEDKNILNTINNLIYDYEESEKLYQLDNLKNELLIKTNGNKEEAERLYEKEKNAYSESSNILDLLYNLINDTDKYQVSSNTIKLALSFHKEFIIKALENINKEINESEINFNIDDIYASTKDGKNLDKVKEDIKNSAERKYPDDDKTLILLSLVICIIGLIAVLLSTNNSTISLITLAIILLVNVIIINKLNKKGRLINEQKKSYIDNIRGLYEKNFAECTDYFNIMQEEKELLNNLITKIQNINLNNVIKLNERNINIE